MRPNSTSLGTAVTMSAKSFECRLVTMITFKDVFWTKYLDISENK